MGNNITLKKHQNLLTHLGNNLVSFKSSWLIVILMTTLFIQCKKDDFKGGTTGVCPIVVSTDPANGATNVATSKKITATFNEAMNPSTINATTFILSQGANQIPGVVTYADKTATFTPSNPLDANTVYTATITNGVKDPSNNAMIANFVWSFNTGAIPIVVSTDPANGAINVPLGKIITATFSTNMDPATITASSFILRQGTTVIPGTISYAGMVATFSPTAPLNPNTVYTGTITKDAKDVSGNAIAANYVWSFVTGIAPTVVSTDPANGETNVVLNKAISATFSTTMDPTTINSTTFLLKQGATSIPGVVTYSGSTAVFTPSANLLPGTVYTATITTGAKNTLGDALASNYVWTFTTGVPLANTPPTVISTDPISAATGVALNKKIAATFSKAMNPLTINNTTFLLNQGANPVLGTVSYSGTTALFSPAVNLLPNTVYTATITTGAKDATGNALANNYVWSFTTGAALDLVPPVVIATDPVNGANGVVIDKKLSATFSKLMNPTTINNTTFLLQQGINPILGTVSYSGMTAVFSPTTNLTPNTTYTATITTGAQDQAGNALASNYVWTFTTAGPIIVGPNLGSIALFGAFGGNAGITNQGLNTMINNGSIGTTAASTLITGFHDATTGDVYTETPLNVGRVAGRIYTAPPAPGTATSFAIATKALLDATNAYNSISPASKPGGIDPGAGELGGLTLAPGVYKSASGTFKITNGDLTLDAKGDPNAVWIFQSPTSLTVGVAGPSGARNVILINGASAKNVYWWVGSAATINGAGGGIMVGTIITSAGLTFSTAGNAVQTVLNGRAISLNASVTMVNTTINVP